MAALGAHYLWYYIYRPVGADPHEDQALDGEQIDALRTFLVEQRGRHPIAIIDTYWDDRGRALCPAATGISLHINPSGDIEPCPPVQVSDCRVAPGQPLAQTIDQSRVLTAFRREIPALTRGCILLDCPAQLEPLAMRCGARDTSGRPGNLAGLARRPPCAGHDRAGREMPERAWGYRLAKRNWFYGFGTYG